MHKEAKEIYDFLDGLKSMKKYESDDKQKIEVAYEKVLGKKFTRTGCPDCYHDAVIEALAYLKKNGKCKPVSRYELYYGEYFRLGGFGSADIYTHATCTDEVAMKYLAETNGNGADKFMKLPENWQEEVAAFATESEEEEENEAPADENATEAEKAEEEEEDFAPAETTKKGKK